MCSAYLGEGIYQLNQTRHPRERLRWLEAALAAARRLNERVSEGAHLGNIGVASLDLGEPQRAIEFIDQDWEIVRETRDRRGESSDRRGEGNIFVNLGSAFYALGKTGDAVKFYEAALSAARELNDRAYEETALGNHGNSYYALGGLERARFV